MSSIQPKKKIIEKPKKLPIKKAYKIYIRKLPPRDFNKNEMQSIIEKVNIHLNSLLPSDPNITNNNSNLVQIEHFIEGKIRFV